MRSPHPLWLCVLLPWAVLWPLPRVATTGLVTSPLSEGPAHLWGWWAAVQTGQPLDLQTSLLNHPEGVSLQLIDPLHALVYAIGAWVSPAFGYNLVLVFGLAVAGAAGWLLAREAGADRAEQLVGVAVGVSAPALVAVGVDGITEGLGVGWVGVQLAALLSLRRGATAGRLAGLFAAMVAGVYAGPYNGVWMAFTDVPVGIWLLRRTMAHLWAGAAALLASAPRAVSLWGRDPLLPGGSGRAALLAPHVGNPWRGGSMHGADLLDLFVPAPLTGEFADVPATAYLGVVTLGLALLSARRDGRRAWPWLLGAAGMAALALGPWLIVGGHIPTWDDRPLAAPAGWLSAWTPLARLSRWTRAGAVAVMLLAPLAARALRGRAALAAGVAVILDARLLAPLPAALPVLDASPSPALAAAPGPIAELPPVHPLFEDGHVADLNLLLQVQHGKPTNGTLHGASGLATSHEALLTLRRAAAGQAESDGSVRRAARDLIGLGYRTLAVYRDRFPAEGLDALQVALGEPIAADERVVVFALGG